MHFSVSLPFGEQFASACRQVGIFHGNYRQLEQNGHKVFLLLLLLQHPVLPWPQFHLVIVSSVLQPSTNVSGDNMFSLVICGCQAVTDQSLWLCDRVLVIEFTAISQQPVGEYTFFPSYQRLPGCCQLASGVTGALLLCAYDFCIRNNAHWFIIDRYPDMARSNLSL